MDDQEKVDLKIYDMPVELKNKYISMAKLDYDNQLWRVLEAGMERLEEERETKVPQLEDDVESLQKQIVYLKTRIENLEGDKEKEEQNTGPVTFGSEPEEIKKESDDELLDRFD